MSFIACPGCNAIIDACWACCPGCGRCPGCGERRFKEIGGPCPNCNHPADPVKLEELEKQFGVP